jgi:hypothetical protein
MFTNGLPLLLIFVRRDVFRQSRKSQIAKITEMRDVKPLGHKFGYFIHNVVQDNKLGG